MPANERELASVPGMSVGIVSAAQGSYSPTQLLLDISQGARVANSAYPYNPPPALSLTVSRAEGLIAGWPAARARAQAAPQLLRPGLLAAQVPGAGAYAGVTGGAGIDAIAAANRAGRVSAVSLGSASTLLARIETLGSRRRFVVAELPAGRAGYEDLRALAAARAPTQLLLVLQQASSAPHHELLWLGAAGLRAGGPLRGAGARGGAGSSAQRDLTSQTTEERGLVASFDIAPTILGHLGLGVPADMRGRPIETDSSLDGSALRALMDRLQVLGARRLSALGWLLSAWALLLLAAATWAAACSRLARVRPSDRSEARASRAAAAPAWAMRIGGLGVLWAPVVVLVPAALHPSAAIEYATVALCCMALGALSDLALPWPRAPLAPAIAAVLALGVDALAGTQLLIRSLLGPAPALGARFYGFGNELKSGMAVLVFAAVAAALHPARRSRRAAMTMALAGIALAAFEGSARLGAGVGGVVLVSAGTAVAAVMLLPGAITRRRVLIVLTAPVVGLVVLAGLDLATAHGSGHYTGSILHARSAADLRDVLVRRYKAAWDELRNHAMPVATALSLLAGVLGVRERARLLAPVAGDPGWQAALAGGLTAGVIGALAEDSGPVLLVVAVFCLVCVLSYLWGAPPLRQRSPGMSHGARSRALTPSAGPAR